MVISYKVSGRDSTFRIRAKSAKEAAEEYAEFHCGVRFGTSETLTVSWSDEHGRYTEKWQATVKLSRKF